MEQICFLYAFKNCPLDRSFYFEGYKKIKLYPPKNNEIGYKTDESNATRIKKLKIKFLSCGCK